MTNLTSLVYSIAKPEFIVNIVSLGYGLQHFTNNHFVSAVARRGRRPSALVTVRARASGILSPSPYRGKKTRKGIFLHFKRQEH
jgi:hypothetical protein